MTTSTERAKELYDRLFRGGGHRNSPVSIDPLAIIAQAIREAEDAALERAAVHFEKQAPAIQCAVMGLTSLAPVGANLVAMFAEAIPKDLRSLKSQEPSP